MTIGFFEMEDWEVDYIKPKLTGSELLFLNADAQTQDTSRVEAVSNFIGFPITRERLKQFPKLKYVATRSTGYDHIDLKACQERGILVSNVPAYGENTVAEFAFALLLGLSRKLLPAAKQVREQGLFATDNLQGFDLRGRVLGVVGTGHIGAYVIKIAAGFGMEVVAYDPHPNDGLAKQYGFMYLPLAELLKTSDVVTLHVPYMPETHHLINSQNIVLCKKGSVIINTARGGLIETAALVAALKSGQLAGAGLDVLEEEGFMKDELEMLHSGHPNQEQLKIALADHELMYMDNVIITPHNAFNTREALIRILDTTVENIKIFTAGKPANLVKV